MNISELQKIQKKAKISMQNIKTDEEQERKQKIEKKAKWYLEGFNETLKQVAIKAANEGKNEAVVMQVGPFWVAGWFDEVTKKAAEMAVVYVKKKYDGFNFWLDDGFIWASWPESS